MAHWIIDDHGFGGQYYRCSECGESWCDIYSDVSMNENCPNCGAPMNEDETEYIEKKKKSIPAFNPFRFITANGEALRRYEERETKLRQLTGYNIEKLIELFAAGYTLQPPEYTRENIICVPSEGMGEVSDGYHTFNELYDHRAKLFSVICNSNKGLAWKSKLHDTGDMYDGMFIVGINTPEGPATYHYMPKPWVKS